MLTSHPFDILIMAAGTSSRLGEPKQLLELNGRSLLWHAATQALKLSPFVTVVLGHQSNQCREALKGLSVKTVVNENYKEGLGNSIAYGVSSLNTSSPVMIMLCDQPLIPQSHYVSLLQASINNPDIIIASHYDKKSGVPAVFPTHYLPILKELKGDKGAKILLETNIYQYIPLAKEYSRDIDTQEDWEAIVTLFSYHI